MRLTIATKSGKRIPQVSAERLVNMYAEPADGVSNVIVHGASGLDLFADCGVGPVRGMERHNGILYVVAGSELYQVNSVGGVVSKGAIAGTCGCVGMASNGTYLCIVTGTGNPGYLYGTSLAQITDSDFGGAETVDSIDGYFLFSDGSGSFFINETPFDGTNYDALDFASAESNPDNIVRVFVDHREVLLFGEETMEAWYNSGNADFPFERTPGAITEKGLASADAVARIDNTVFWLDHHGVARRLAEGYNAQRISTHAVEAAFGTLSTAEAIAFVEAGHEFFVLSFDNGTWVFDAATGLWHQRQSWEEPRWRVCCHEWVYGKNLVGDYESGKIYALNPATFMESGDPLVSEMIFPPIQVDGGKFKVPSVQLDLEQGSAGNVRLWISDDGEEWHDAGVRSLGPVGDRNARTIWRGLGQHRNLHLRFSISDDVRRAVFAAYANVSN